MACRSSSEYCGKKGKTYPISQNEHLFHNVLATYPHNCTHCYREPVGPDRSLQGERLRKVVRSVTQGYSAVPQRAIEERYAALPTGSIVAFKSDGLLESVVSPSGLAIAHVRHG